MQISKKIRLYPNKEQEELFWQFAGTSRWAWNESLAYRMNRYEKDCSNTTIQQGCTDNDREDIFKLFWLDDLEQLKEQNNDSGKSKRD